MAIIDNLAAFWDFEDLDFTDTNDVHGTSHLTNNNIVVTAAGKVGLAADFETDSSQNLSVGDNAALSMGDIEATFVAWVQLESAPGTPKMTVLAKDSGTSGEYYLQYNGGTSRFELTVCGASAFGSLTAVVGNNFGAASLATWYFLVAQHDPVANTIALSINNGTPNSAAHSAGIFDGTGTFRIGGDSFAENFDGLVDQVGIWKRLLTGAEITWLYNSGAGRSYADIVAGMGAASASGPQFRYRRQMRNRALTRM